MPGLRSLAVVALTGGHWQAFGSRRGWRRRQPVLQTQCRHAEVDMQIMPYLQGFAASGHTMVNHRTDRPRAGRKGFSRAMLTRSSTISGSVGAGARRGDRCRLPCSRGWSRARPGVGKNRSSPTALQVTPRIICAMSLGAEIEIFRKTIRENPCEAVMRLENYRCGYLGTSIKYSNDKK